jgi:hypothetical protein
MLAAHWDVDELKGEPKEKMEGQWNYLKDVLCFSTTYLSFI